MSNTWQMKEVRSKLGQVIDAALKHGPQVISRRGVETAVVLSYKEYRKMMLNQKKLSDFFRESPLMGTDIDLNRDKSP